MDIATSCGWAIGRVGERPRWGTWVLKAPEAEQIRAAKNLAIHLRDMFVLERPDLIVYEAAMNPAQKLRQGDAVRSVTLPWQLIGAAGAIAGAYGIRIIAANVQTVRKAVLGNGRPENPKQVAAEHCKRLGFNISNFDEADAVVMWIYQSSLERLADQVVAA